MAGTKNCPLSPPTPKGSPRATRPSKVLNAIAKNDPWLMGGSADLYPSTKTRLTFDGAGDFEANNYNARNFHFGIREHAMGAIVNGMALSYLAHLWVDFPHLLRLHEARDPSLGDHGNSVDLDLHARLHRRRRRRAHAPTHRATGHAARGSRPDDDPARPTRMKWSKPGK